MPVPAEAAVVDSARARVRAIVATFFKMTPEAIDPDVPLALLGLDSLRALELVAALEEAFGRGLPEWLLIEHPDISSLALALGGEAGPPEAGHLAQIVADSVLPHGIRPSMAQRVGPPRHVLLTGATGFLGAYLLRELLIRTDADVHCLVRLQGSDTPGRIRANLERFGLWQPAVASRIHVVPGDLTLANLGLAPGDHDRLGRTIDAIYHSAADLDWTVSYPALRATNVLGTLELLRLAAASAPSAFHFVSSLSVCYAAEGPPRVYEEDDLLPLVDRLPLGYAQSKCVAEALVRQAAERGLPATIHRPALIAGDSATGASNPDDLISALVKGCIQMGAAPDLDWTFDAVPVDFAARAIVLLAGTPGGGLRTFHLANARPRHWRECVLWMNLFGYPIALQPYDRWRDRVAREAVTPEHALTRLRPFLLRRASSAGSVPELYQDSRRSASDTAYTRRAERAAGLDCPRVDAEQLDRYFRHYIASGFLPPPAARSLASRRSRPPYHARPGFLEAMLCRHFGDDGLRVKRQELLSSGSDHSIIGELASWRDGRQAGLFRYRLALDSRTAPRTLDVVVKAKPSDRTVIEVGETVAAICDPSLGEAFRRFGARIGPRAGHLREPSMYREADAALRQRMPTCFGAWNRDDRGEWGVALEWLGDAALIDTADDPAVWKPAQIAAVIDDLAVIHASWYRRDVALCERPWIGYVPSLAGAVEMTPLWRALGEHAAPFLEEWAGPKLAATHRRLVDSIAAWWQPLESQDRTLIHNDFNPRNLALRADGEGLGLCAYDWELATVGIPQHDLAEFLCFVLADDVCAKELDAWVERHRRRLLALTAHAPDPGAWHAGFRAALEDLLVNRLACYVLANRIRPQRFLPRVVRTWQRLHDLATTGESQP
jgi:thioester reductase-like protein